MATAGERLAAVQRTGHRVINAVYGHLAADVERVILSAATPDASGVLRLSLNARTVILNDVGYRLDIIRPDLVTVVRGTMAAAVAVAQVGVEPLPNWEAATLAPLGQLPLFLATDRPSVLGQTAALLLRGVEAVLPARLIAKQVAQYFSPLGRGSVQSWPGRAGMASQHARLVMLSETTAAHSRTMKRLAQRDDQLLRYHVSHKHLETDQCDVNERTDSGFGAGIYEPDAAPSVPVHPRCRCWYEPADRPRFLTQSESVPA